MRRGAIAVLSALFVVSALVTTPGLAATPVDTSALRTAVTLEGVREHQKAFQQIANRNDGIRLAGTGGYDDSADYVAGRLESAGYAVTRQPFDFAFFQELATPELDRVSPDPRAYVGEDFFTMQYSGSGEPTAPLQAVDVIIPPGATANTSTSGCEASDFAGFVAGNIALIQRGTCTFFQKALNAQNAGASGAIIFNEGQAGRTDAILGTLGSPDFTIPVVGASFALGEENFNLLLSGPVTMHMFTSTLSEIRTTENVIGETTGGNPDRTVVVGAHLDSVAEGPGINDNGSGSGVILEIAEEMAELGIEPANKVRFAFWGAEEEGLLGSEFYVSQLSRQEINDIALNLNFDMLGSPNFVRFVYDGDGSDTPIRGPAGSDAIEDVFLDYFAGQGLPVEPTAFDGRSDYGPFIAVGIPAGGLFSGAEGIKTPEQVAIYGGIAGEQYDPCYHEACDTFKGSGSGGGATAPGLGPVVLDQFSDATAHAVLVFAMTGTDVSGTGRGSVQTDLRGAFARR